MLPWFQLHPLWDGRVGCRRRELGGESDLHPGRYIASHPQFCGLTFETLSGEVAAGIVKYASDHAAELIVMPTHGLRGIKRFLLGSVTQKVLTHAPCEVLVQRFPG